MKSAVLDEIGPVHSACGSLYVSWMLQIPGPRVWCLSGAFYYVMKGLNTYIAIELFLDGETRAGVALVAALVLPQVVHAGMCAIVLQFSAMPAHEIRRVGTLMALDCHRAVVAFRYLKLAEMPNWGFAGQFKHLALTLKTLPAFVQMSLLSFQRKGTFLQRVSMVAMVLGSISAAKFDHVATGPPQNLEKYRYWNLKGSPVLHCIVVQILDMVQIWYRIIVVTLAFALADSRVVVLLILLQCWIASVHFSTNNCQLKKGTFWTKVVAGFGMPLSVFVHECSRLLLAGAKYIKRCLVEESLLV